MIFLSEKLEISPINQEKCKTILEKSIHINQVDFYYIKLSKAIETSLSIKNIITCYILNLLIDINDYIY